MGLSPEAAGLGRAGSAALTKPPQQVGPASGIRDSQGPAAVTLHGLDIMQTDRRAHRNLGKSACSHWLETLTDPVHWTGQGDIRPPYPLSRESVCHIVLAALKK